MLALVLTGEGAIMLHVRNGIASIARKAFDPVLSEAMPGGMDHSVAIDAPPSLENLLAGQPVALFLDFDGTLVDIAPTPGSIHVPQNLGARLKSLADRLDGRLALISGRSLDDVAHHVGELSIARAGSHGLDRLGPQGQRIGPEPDPVSERVCDEIINFATSFDGMDVERKHHGIALHFRGAPHFEAQASAFAERTAGTHGLSVKRGKCVVELVHPDADKAAAVRAFMAEPSFAGAMPVFIGDDVTDEDGFVACREMGGMAILVGDRPGSCANFGISTPAKVLEWLAI